MDFVVSGIRISTRVSEPSAVRRVSEPSVQSENPEPCTVLNPGQSLGAMNHNTTKE